MQSSCPLYILHLSHFSTTLMIITVTDRIHVALFWSPLSIDTAFKLPGVDAKLRV